MQANWNITYGILTEASIEDGDYAEEGFEACDLTFREAIGYFGSYSGGLETDCWPVTPASPPRWITRPNIHESCYGQYKDLALHIPKQITASSRIRLARLLGIRIY